MIGDIEIKKEIFNEDIAKELNNRFIAVDVETTGLDYTNCLIIEIGLSLFENKKLVKKYGSLIHINELIDDNIIELTGITNDMLFKAPREEVVYKEVSEFLSDALEGNTLLVAHNADFDMNFISRALIRYGYLGVLRYVDTLNISRSLVKGLFNYKQSTVAQYFNIINDNEHRALSDAITCGYILTNLLEVDDNKSQLMEFFTKYDSLFEERVRERGAIYYRFNKIENYSEDNNICTCNITGASTYNVKLKVLDDKVEGECNCPYYNDNKTLCKHIYALLLKYTYTNKK